MDFREFVLAVWNYASLPQLVRQWAYYSEQCRAGSPSLHSTPSSRFGSGVGSASSASTAHALESKQVPLTLPNGS